MNNNIKKKPNLGRIPLPKKAGFAFKDKSKYNRKKKHKHKQCEEKWNHKLYST